MRFTAWVLATQVGCSVDLDAMLQAPGGPRGARVSTTAGGFEAMSPEAQAWARPSGEVTVPIRGVVRNRLGEPVPRATILAQRKPFPLAGTFLAVTDEDGTFASEVDPLSTVWVQGFAEDTRAVGLDGQDENEFAWEIDGLVDAVFDVKRPDGRYETRDVAFRLWNFRDRRSEPELGVTESGRATLRLPANGTHLQALGPLGLGLEFEWSPPADPTHATSVELAQGGLLVFEVRLPPSAASRTVRAGATLAVAPNVRVWTGVHAYVASEVSGRDADYLSFVAETARSGGHAFLGKSSAPAWLSQMFQYATRQSAHVWESERTLMPMHLVEVTCPTLPGVCAGFDGMRCGTAEQDDEGTCLRLEDRWVCHCPSDRESWVRAAGIYATVKPTDRHVALDLHEFGGAISIQVPEGFCKERFQGHLRSPIGKATQELVERFRGAFYDGGFARRGLCENGMLRFDAVPPGEWHLSVHEHFYDPDGPLSAIRVDDAEVDVTALYEPPS